jgi:stearoyl-CoA desaturase (delta-9 desaturase)
MGDATIKKRMVLERKDLLLKQIKDLWYLKKDEIAKQIEEISERLLEQLSRFNQLELEYRALAISRQALKMEIKAIQKNMRSDWRQWSQLSRLILHLKPLPA